ncbi:hypothetical protein ABCR94_31165 [Streptomyces sp. 21So2-11]|uniref:hypothetical protein n=1 Tax=Streptomyces sp. 21So2-11 TaxID=3144408 RepID=UPI00321A8E6D
MSSTSRLVVVSSAPVGSSAKSTAGRVISARAIATRCCCPPGPTSLGERCRWATYSEPCNRPPARPAVHHGHTVLHADNDFAAVGEALKEVQQRDVRA